MKTDFWICIISFIIIFIIDYLININKLNLLNNKSNKKKKRKKKKEDEFIEIKYLILKLKKEKLLTKRIITIISLMNSFIISLVAFTIFLIPYKIMWQLLIGFVLLVGLIYSLYNILGKILIKKGYNK